MPIYNGIEFIDESVNSIINQTYQEWELIIGINGHPPNSSVFQKAKEYENKKIKILDLFEINPNPSELNGKSKALNEMIKNAKHNWIALLDVDDIWLPTKLEKQIPFLENYDVIGTMCQFIGIFQKIPSLPLNEINDFDFLSKNPIINSSCLVRKELCYWSNHLLEDYELWLKLWKQGKKFYNVPSIEVIHRIHWGCFFKHKTNNQIIMELQDTYR